MPFFSKIIKPLLALALSAAVLGAEQGCTKASAPSASAAPEAKPGEPRTIALTITEKGYEPSPITLQQGQPVKLVLTRTTEHTCATEIVLDEYNINTPVPLNQPVEVAFTPTKTGKLVYGCAMGKMISGVFMVE
ncbi:Lead, cadmium, zinc and mercury transporting ATPase [Cystobacter fuscus DSM 2262]|uniref:Lead, cadmium, zinc and mercury transporting ATPase n=1 Tax=Cystobacter fuscus (strain ATCC 25194 / DSM 2262 / NBRC 100088 / M29) TaxID=1242864 RepID=S9QBT8_CYSF2|nr:cupredoxin domain-containing protein [Cystobacter fuscus]EPX58784.1 Lead, cadmium, zinc and mercury transporting ATPase [Cystobacter fuscus DSM 2262]